MLHKGKFAFEMTIGLGLEIGNIKCEAYTVQSRFSDTLFSDKSQFSDNFDSDNFALDHFLVHKNISFSDNLVFSATPI